MASDNDFIEALSDAGRKEAGADYLKKLKTSGAKEMVQHGIAKALMHKPEIISALAGAALAGAGTYAMSKGGKGGKPSAEQRMARSLVSSSQTADHEDAAAGKTPKFRQAITRAAAPGISNIADVLAKHPGKAALMAAPFGATAGLRLLKSLK